jgi:hypothetical protein
MGEIDVPCSFTPRARGDRRFQAVPFSTFLVDTASAFLPKGLLGSGFCLGLGKAKVYHERPEMSSPREIREGQNN